MNHNLGLGLPRCLTGHHLFDSICCLSLNWASTLGRLVDPSIWKLAWSVFTKDTTAKYSIWVLKQQPLLSPYPLSYAVAVCSLWNKCWEENIAAKEEVYVLNKKGWIQVGMRLCESLSWGVVDKHKIPFWSFDIWSKEENYYSGFHHNCEVKQGTNYDIV